MHRIVEKIMGGDEAMASFLQRLLGYGITGEVREEIFPIWTGSGRNGKGLLTQAMQQLLGAYYKEMNCAIISDSRVCSNIDAERAKLIGARLAVFNELKDGEKLKTNEVQLLTGGDGFPAKALYKDPVTVQPRHLAILVTNYMPEMSDAIVAMVERLMVVEFPVTFRDLIPGENETVTLRQSDKTMKERLKSPEGQSALFAWLVEGAVAWYSGTESLKAGAPKKVTEFTRQYLADQDGVQAFLAENCEFGEDFRVSGVALFNMYREGSVKKTGKGCSDYFIFEEDTCRWAKVDEGRVKSVVVEAMEEALRDVDLWIATQSAQRRLQGGDAKMRVANLDLKKREVVSLIRIIQKIMGGDEAMAKFIQRLLGYGITGEVREEIFPIWTGSGRNGKGLLTQALQQLLGAYYKEMNCAIISDSRVCSNIDAERAKLIGARLAVFNELKSGEKLKTNEVQLLTGGDGFPVKEVYKNPVTIQPRHLAILVTNHMPEMSDMDLPDMTYSGRNITDALLPVAAARRTLT
eukprot:gene8842-biopygen699